MRYRTQYTVYQNIGQNKIANIKIGLVTSFIGSLVLHLCTFPDSLTSYISGYFSLVHNEKMAPDVALGTEQDDTEHVDSDSSTNVAVQVEGTTVKNRSIVWKYFRKAAGQDGVRVQCEVCDKTIKTTGGNTTNL